VNIWLVLYRISLSEDAGLKHFRESLTVYEEKIGAVKQSFNTFSGAQKFGYGISRGIRQNRSRKDADNAYLKDRGKHK
jgi:hypothetical protein